MNNGVNNQTVNQNVTTNTQPIPAVPMQPQQQAIPAQQTVTTQPIMTPQTQPQVQTQVQQTIQQPAPKASVPQQPQTTQPVDKTKENPTVDPKEIKKQEQEKKKKEKEEEKKRKKEEKTKQKQDKKSNPFIRLLIIIIILMGFYIIYITLSNKEQIKQLNFNCTPVSTLKETKELDINSTIVKDLYSKVQTNIKEDLAEVELNDEMKLYLAHRQIVPSKIYDSNCTMFKPTDMISYTCVDNKTNTPQAFKQETLQIELKKLFGEQTNIELKDIQLGKACIGGYNYIPERQEYVQGTCTKYSATSFRVTKKLKEAKSNNSTIILKEEVKYYGNEQLDVPDYLKSGTYVYTFKLDTNYNYVYVSKELEEKY